MSKVSRMSIKDILKQTDIILRDNDIVYFCDVIPVINEFINKYSTGRAQREDVEKFLTRNEKYLDKEKFVLLTALNYKDNLEIINNRIIELSKDISREAFVERENLKMQLKKQKENYLKTMKLGIGMESIVTFYNYDEKEGRYKVNPISSKEFIDGKRINPIKEQKRFDKVDFNLRNNPKDEIGIEYAIQSILLTDLGNIFSDEQFGNDIRTMILENEVLKKKIKTKQELEELRGTNNGEEYIELIDNMDYEDVLFSTKQVLREYSQYMDMDKFLLISAYRFNEALENGSINQEKYSSTKKILQGILENIEIPNAQISCELQSKKNNTYEFEQVKYSAQDIKKCISQFTENSYIKTEEIKEYKEKINKKEISLSEIPEENINAIFSRKELEDLSTLSVENLMYVYEKYNWDESRIINLYKSGEISLETIKHIEEEVYLSDAIKIEELNMYYKKLIKNSQDEKAIDQYSRYLELYKEILIDGKDKEQIQEVSELGIKKMIEGFEEKEYNKAVKEYYMQGIITLSSIAQWSNENTITQLYNEGIISLEDLARLTKDNKLSSEYTRGIYIDLINNNELEYDERLKLIKDGIINEEDILELYNKNLIFENDLRQLAKDEIIKEEGMQKVIDSRTMEELEKNSSIILTGLNNLTKKNNEVYSHGIYSAGSDKIIQTGKEIIDPNEREKFIKKLKAYRANTDLNEDSPFYNYEFYVIPDESKKIGLNSVVIAERYYDDKNTEKRFATNNATYFFKYKDLMVLSNLKKSEMTKERKDIVFTSNHVLAHGDKDGYWASSVIASLAKTMLSSDLKEYSKKEQKSAILQKLKEVYEPEELIEIIDMAKEIDSGKHICEIEEYIINRKRVETLIYRKTKNKDISDSEEGR